MNKIIYYYQTFTGLTPILNDTKTTHIYISSLHFGTKNDDTPYIHLNNYPPDDLKFNDLWKECQEADNKGVTLMFMLGGAGGAYGNLFSNYNIYYPMLKKTIEKYSFIKGIDLDIEENVDINNVKKLINNLDNNFGKDFIITMAPIGSSLITDSPGLGNFVYKDLFNSSEGKRINWFNGQFYLTYDDDIFEKAVNNGYPPEKIVFGMISSQFTSSNFNDALQNILNVKKKHDNFGGVFVWEYCNAPPKGILDPSEWSKDIYNVFKKID